MGVQAEDVAYADDYANFDHRQIWFDPETIAVDDFLDSVLTDAVQRRDIRTVYQVFFSKQTLYNSYSL